MEWKWNWLIGKILILKSYLISGIGYPVEMIGSNPCHIKVMHELYAEFVWKSKVCSGIARHNGYEYAQITNLWIL